MTVIDLSRLQVRRWPLWLVGAVRVVLRLQAHACMSRITVAMLAGKAAVQEVSGIYLQAGLIGEHLQPDACLWTVEACCHNFVVALSVLVSVQAPVMIKSHGVLRHVEELVVDVF